MTGMKEQSADWQLRSAWARYSVALTLFAVALSARLLLLPVEARLAFSTFLPAVVVALYLCGLAPGSLIAVLSAVAGIYFFSPPYHVFDADVASLTAALAFLGGCGGLRRFT